MVARLVEWLDAITEPTVVVINGLALVSVAARTVEAFVRGILALVRRSESATLRELWLRHARWLVAGLTFQLSADIIETAITKEWQAVGRIAAIAVIRTFLNFFLERDVREMNEHPSARQA